MCANVLLLSVAVTTDRNTVHIRDKRTPKQSRLSCVLKALVELGGLLRAVDPQSLCCLCPADSGRAQGRWNLEAQRHGL